MFVNVRRYPRNVPVILVNLMKLEFSEKYSISNLMKIYPVGAELYHAGGRTDRMKLTVVFRNCGNAPKNYFAIGKGETR